MARSLYPQNISLLARCSDCSIRFACRFECEGTVEQKIATLHAKKKELAQSVLSGTGNAVAKLSLADLKIIFGV